METLTIDEACERLRMLIGYGRHTVTIAVVSGGHTDSCTFGVDAGLTSGDAASSVPVLRCHQSTPSGPPSVDSTDAVEHEKRHTIGIDLEMKGDVADAVRRVDDRLDRLERWREAVLPLLSGLACIMTWTNDSRALSGEPTFEDLKEHYRIHRMTNEALHVSCGDDATHYHTAAESHFEGDGD